MFYSFPSEICAAWDGHRHRLKTAKTNAKVSIPSHALPLPGPCAKVPGKFINLGNKKNDYNDFCRMVGRVKVPKWRRKILIQHDTTRYN